MFAAVEAAGLVDPHPAGPGQSEGLDPILAVSLQGGGISVRAALATVGAFIQTEENMLVVMAHAQL
jgi:hypothetical protein